jgi:hypothetical protein
VPDKLHALVAKWLTLGMLLPFDRATLQRMRRSMGRYGYMERPDREWSTELKHLG